MVQIIDSGANIIIREDALGNEQEMSFAKNEIILEWERDADITRNYFKFTHAGKNTLLVRIPYHKISVPSAATPALMSDALDAIIFSNASTVSGSVSVSSGSVTANIPTSAHTLTSTNATSSGSVASGSYAVGFKTSANFVGTINGVTRGANEFISYQAKLNNTLPAIAYTISAGSILIDRIV